MTFEDIIVSNLIFNSEYALKVLPYTKEEYFSNPQSIIVDEIVKFFNDYGNTPSKGELASEIQARKGLSDKKVLELTDYVNNIQEDKSDPVWLVSKTEKLYQQRALSNAILKGSDILLMENGKENEILDLVQKALAVSFDSSIGLDYFYDVNRRYQMYHAEEDKVSWGIKALDDICCGGMSKKNLICLVAPTGVGKSLFMCSIASNIIRNGQNVLYISMEMSEERVAERIDANLFNTSIADLRVMPEADYYSKADKIKNRFKGQLVIREYPTSGANTNHFKNLLSDLRNKKGFVPDIIIVDYLNICSSARYKAGQTNSYGFIKAISEELRGLAVEQNCVVLTATQTNRGGINNSDLEMTDISESIGTVFVLDMFFALVRTDALDESGQIMVKQLKNRYSDLGAKPQILLGLDRDKMKVYDLDSTSNYLNAANYASKKPMTDFGPTGSSMLSRPTTDFSSFNY